MKKLFYLLFMFGLWIPRIQAQYVINDELRELLSTIAPASFPAPFFYDIAAHETEEKFWVPININDTLTTEKFWAIHFEANQMSFNPNILPETFNLRYQAMQREKTDTFPIGILDIEYNRLVSNAFDSGVYFGWNDFDLWDIPGRANEPYRINTTHPHRGTLLDAFVSAPLISSSSFRDVIFEINPQFISASMPFNSYTQLPPNHSWYINFGDGSGWKSFNPSINQTFDIEYPSSGLYQIEVKVEADFLVRYSKSIFAVTSDDKKIKPDEIITDIPGIKAGLYYDCTGNPNFDKLIIAVSGFDFFETQTIPKIYNQLINEPQLIMLQNYGYAVLCVDWEDSKEDLTVNGDRLIALLEHLKCRSNNVAHNFTIVGISMGALIANYSLTKMETASYLSSIQNNPDICFPEQIHNTRTFISLEAEHQGAFVNLGVQELSKILDQDQMIAKIPSFEINRLKVDAHFLYHEILNRKGIKQMLMYHIDSFDGLGHFFPHTERIRFLNLLQFLGNKPQKVKTVAMGNALANGKNQVAIGNRLGKAGDFYYDFKSRTNLSFAFGLIEPIELDITLRTHPDANLANDPNYHVLSFNLHAPRKLNIKGCLGKLLTLGLCRKCRCILYHDNQQNFRITDTIPWDILCGSRISATSAIFQNPSVPSGFSFNTKPISGGGLLLINYGLMINPNTGTASAFGWAGPKINTIHGPIALPLITSTASVFSQIESFNFVPWQSPYDYQRPDSLQQDLMSTSIDSNLARTPFDVMISMVPHASFPKTWVDPNHGEKHFEHREMRADIVDTALDLTIITREIGETYMHLDNQTINRRSWFEAEHDLNAGKEANSYWDYPFKQPVKNYGSIWSKDSGFYVTSSSGYAHFRAGRQVRLQPGFSVSDSGQLHAWIQPMQVCNYTLDELRNKIPSAPLASIHQASSEVRGLSQAIKVYPNPTRNHITIFVPNATPFILSDMHGRVLQSDQLMAGENRLNLLSYPSGIYTLYLPLHNKPFKIVKQ